jgi:tetratricopeptide (TPR) repeat protein
MKRPIWRWYDRCFPLGVMMSGSIPRIPILLAAAALAMVTVLAVSAPAPGQPGKVASTDELFSLGRDAFARGEYAKAQEYYETILRRDRTNLQAILELSSIYERSGKLEYARGLLIRATRIDPDYAAIEERRQAIDVKLALVLTAEVDSLLQRGAYEAAIPKLSLHNSITPGDPSVHYKRALCLFEMGRFDAALTDIEVAIAAEPQEPYFVLRDRIVGESTRSHVRELATRASRLAKSDNPQNRERALDLLGEILEAEPDHTWARNEFLRLSEGGGDDTPPGAATEGRSPGALPDIVAAFVSAAASLGGFVRAHVGALVALLAVVIVFRSPLTTALKQRLARAPLLTGDLSRFSVSEVLNMLNAGPHTGVLEVRATSRSGKVYLDGGEPTHCTTGRKEGPEALMALLDAAQKGRFVFVAGSPPARQTIDTPLSVLMVEEAHRTARPGVASAKKSRMKELLDKKLEV